MRLHRIEVQAFGPFADRQVIDVDALGDAGLFLIHGQTGAGKTTLLDAVSFALFGSVPGVRPDGDSLRSHHAAPGVPTEVVVEVSFGERRLRIHRSPKQRRPKKKGEGFVEEPAHSTAEAWQDGDWQPLTNRNDEVGQLVADHVGMGAAQFHQVVLLPQGDFATFLRASAEDRRPLLEKLFATHRFADVEHWLDDRRKEVAARLGSGRDDLRQAIAAVHALTRHVDGTPDAGGEAPDKPSDDDLAALGPDEARRWATAQLAAARAEVTATNEQLTAARAARRAATEAHELATALAERQERYRAAAAHLTALDGTADEQARRVAALEAHRRAEPVRPLAAEALRLRAVADDARHQVATRRRAVATAEPDLAEAAPAALSARRDELVGVLAGLPELAEVEEQVARRTRDIDAQRAELDGVKQAHDEAAAALAALPAQQEQLRADLAEATMAGGGLDGLRSALTDIERRVVAARKRDALQARLAAARAEVVEAVDAHQRAKDRHLQLLGDRLDNMAAELATDLQPGAACPVCGSHEHPTPATTSDKALVTADAVDEAAEQAQRAEVARADAVADVAELERLLAAEQAVAADESVDDLVALEAEARAELAAVAAMAARATDLTSALGALAADEQRWRTTQDEAARQQAALEAAIASAEQAQADDGRRLAEALADAGSIAEVVTRHEGTLDALDALLAALATATTTDRQAHDAEVAAEREATTAGFLDVATAQAALLDATAAGELADAVERHTSDVAAARQVLGDPDLVAAAALPRADVDATRAKVLEADAIGAAAEARAGSAATTAALLEAAVARVEGCAGAIAPLMAEHDEIARLADLVLGRGDNALRMRLSTYVLAARLEQVAAAASIRLQHMSGNRYTLRHTDEERDGRRRGGLGLRVIDAWSGTERDTTSLSGGESFMASLALALGMADVVTAESGGTRIDTLFIDEGFGSLDDETLQLVMDVLDDLRDGGRTVGIVSHVADLRSRITTQLQVHKGQQGSRVDQTSVAA